MGWMKTITIFAFIVAFAHALPSSNTERVKPAVNNEEAIAIAEEIPLTTTYDNEQETKAPEIIPEEILEEAIAKEIKVEAIPFESLRSDEEKDDIVISKDNLMPFLKTIALAFTHEKDPTYQQIMTATGKTLLKLAEKKMGHDKYMGNLLKIVKKYVENLDLKELSEEEQEVLGDLAEKYLKKNKFTVLFPESFLLHQPEMEQFVNKKKELVAVESRQLNFDFTPYVQSLSTLTSTIRARFANMTMFKNMPNLERIGTSLSTLRNSLTQSFDEYIPAIRQGAGLSDIGISFGSLTALAAAGALISAPFFINRFGSDREDETNEIYFDNRRVSTGFAPNQFITPPKMDDNGDVMRPQWIAKMDNEQRVNEQLQGQPQYVPQNNEQQSDDEEYNKYLNEYNEWLFNYHNAVSEKQHADDEYGEYFKKYRQWYDQYYTEQFGEAPPQQQQNVAPNAYENSNNIQGMAPPPPSPNYPQQQQHQYQQQQQNQQQGEEEPTLFYQGTPNDDSHKHETFQIFQVDENGNKVPYNQQESDQSEQNFQTVQYQHPEPSLDRVIQETEGPKIIEAPLIYNSQQEVLPRPSPYVGQPIQNQVIFRPQFSYHQQQPTIVQPRPVYRPSESPVAPETGFQPVNQQENQNQYDQSQNQRENQNQYGQIQNQQENQNQYDQIQNQYDAIPKQDDFVYYEEEAELPTVGSQLSAEEEFTPETPVEDQESNFGPIQPSSVFEYPKYFKEQANPEIYTQQTTPKISEITSGIFKTTPAPTPSAATTPTPKYYKKPFNKSVRVVTSKSVITSAPFIKPQALKSEKDNTLKKRKFTLTELLNQNKQIVNSYEREENDKKEDLSKIIEPREEPTIASRADIVPEHEIQLVETPVAPRKEKVPLYALDPFYGPRLSRIDSIFAQLKLKHEGCREQVICNMYKNPNAYTPLSDFLSRQLTVTYDQLREPTLNDERLTRFFRYLTAARDGQDSHNCATTYPNCATDTTQLSYKPIVDAYKKVTKLMKSNPQ